MLHYRIFINCFDLKNFLTLLLLFTVLNSLPSQNLDAQLQAILTDYQLMGMSVVKICNGQVGFSRGYGLADYDDLQPITDSTLYRVASISKAVTATALLMLYDQGLFALDDDIGTALGYTLRNPQFPNVPITYRMLLSHTAGIRDGSTYTAFLGATYSANWPSVAAYFVPGGTYYSSSVWGTQLPGSYFNYSNASFGLIATLIERLGGQRFDVFCREKIFQPLGMTASFNLADLPNICNLAALYRFQGGQWVAQHDGFNCQPPVLPNWSGYVVGTNGFIFGPQGSLRTSANDLAKFGLLHLHHGSLGNVHLLQPATATLMRSPQWQYSGSNGNDYDGLFRAWGLGLHLLTNAPGADRVFPDRPMYGHPGEAYGLISDLYFDTLGNGVIFITNGSKNGYSTAAGSAFYTVEAAVFAALFAEVDDCAVTGSQETTANPNDLRVFPNPAGDWVNLYFSPPSGETATATCYDAMGRLQQTLAGISPGQKWDVSRLPTGLYWVKVQTENRTWVGRMQKN